MKGAACRPQIPLDFSLARSIYLGTDRGKGLLWKSGGGFIL